MINKIKEMYRFLYFSFYIMYRGHKRKYDVRWGVAAIVTFLWGFISLIIFFGLDTFFGIDISSIFKTSRIRDNFIWIFSMLLLLPHILYYTRKERHLKIYEEFKNLDKKKKIKRYIIIGIIYFIIITILSILTYLGRNNIRIKLF